MSWVEPFYSETGRWWGPAESRVGERDSARVDTVRRLTGRTSGRVLDLGSSYGSTAAAFALAGYDVVGVELSARQEFGRQHLEQLTRAEGTGSLTLLRGDMSEHETEQRYDVVTYWNGFGIGDDADQRRLLTRAATRWLVPGGHLLLDVFNPTCWIGWAGDRSRREPDPERGYAHGLTEVTDYDPVRTRFVDSWTRDGGHETFTQSQRCYSPADFRLLVEPVPLQVLAMEVDGVPLEETAPSDRHHPLFAAHQYQVLLTTAVTGPS